MPRSTFLTVCMNPTLQKTLVFNDLVINTVNRTSEHILYASGKGINVTRVLKQLGDDALHLCQLGGELRGFFLNLCERDGIRVRWVESHSPIRFCYTVINKNDKNITELVEEAESVKEGTEEKLLAAFKEEIENFTDLIISGSMAGGFSVSLIPQMVNIAKSKGKRVILDIRGDDLKNSFPFNPDVVKPNLFEFASTFAPELIKENEIDYSIVNLREKVEEIWITSSLNESTSLVLSRGDRSIWYCEKGSRKLEEFAFEKIEAINSIGSGDAFTAGLASALGEGASLKEAVKEGHRCAALNAGQLRAGLYS